MGWGRPWNRTLEWEGDPLEWEGETLEWDGVTLEWDPRIGGGPPRMGGELNPKIGSRTSFWYQFFTIGVHMGRYGLILSGFYIINFPACDPTSPKVPKPSK